MANKGAGPFLRIGVAAVTALSAIAAGVGALSTVFDLPFSLRLWAIVTLSMVAELSLFWMIADRIRPLGPAVKTVLALVASLLAAALVWQTLIFSTDHHGIAFVQVDRGHLGRLIFRAGDWPANLTIGLVVNQAAQLHVEVMRRPASGTVSFINVRDYSQTVLLSDFGNRETLEITYDVQSPPGVPFALQVDPHPEMAGTGWLTEAAVEGNRRWSMYAGGAICVIGFFFLLWRSR